MSRQDKIRKRGLERIELNRNIQLCEHYKKKLIRYVQKLDDNYDKGLISYEEYYITRNKVLEHKTVEQWINYYNGFIERYRTELSIAEKEAREERKIKVTPIMPIVAIVAILMILGAGLFFLKPTMITGFVVGHDSINYTMKQLI